jgi:DNA-binding NarL/FixJ family response regulator
MAAPDCARCSGPVVVAVPIGGAMVGAIVVTLTATAHGIETSTQDRHIFLKGLTGPINNIPVIFLSADSTASTISAALPLGVSGYIFKPPNLKLLATKIEQALKGHDTTFFD